MQRNGRCDGCDRSSHSKYDIIRRNDCPERDLLAAPWMSVYFRWNDTLYRNGAMRLRYRLERATQAAAYLLKLRGGRMSYMKLLRLMYLADREALLRMGRPITYDRYVSMDHGPVLSQTYNLLVSEEAPSHESSYWRQHISEPDRYEVTLRIAEPSVSALSPVV